MLNLNFKYSYSFNSDFAGFFNITGCIVLCVHGADDPWTLPEECQRISMWRTRCLFLLVFEVDLPAGNCSCSFALEICLELKELQHMDGWFMYHYTDLTEATEQNKDYCQWQQ